MQEDEFKRKLDLLCLTQVNERYLNNMHQKFLKNPNSIEESWRSLFLELSYITSKNDKPKICRSRSVENQINIKYIASNIISTFRNAGHIYSILDPLNLKKYKPFPKLEVFLNKKNVEIIDQPFSLKLSNFSFHTTTLKKLYSMLFNIYCNNIGYEYMHISCLEEKKWIQNYIERDFEKHVCTSQEKKCLLNNLISAETLEKYFSFKFPGSKRFSLEGAESLIPMLQEVINCAARHNIKKIILGMSHRGRLNVLINILDKPIQNVFNEFFEITKKQNFTNGDVKYHMGFNKDKITRFGTINLDLKFNPSHLEIINPVVVGATRAYQDNIKKHDKKNIFSLVLHGDAAISGQGVVQEILNMSRVRGYKVDGTMHIVLNNQIGFTTSDSNNLRSSKYCTDIAKMIESPVFHVNADNPEATLFVIRLATSFKNRFKKDVFVDLVCYRRHGHNEVDDPFITQPIMYSVIKKHPTVCGIYNKKLIETQVINQDYINNTIKKYKTKLDEKYSEYINGIELKYKHSSHKNDSIIICSKIIKKPSEHDLKKLIKKINIFPPNITIHSRVLKIYNDRLNMANGNKFIDWGAAEALAYAALLNQGISCRLSGEDVGRGTFSHRHAIVYDQISGISYIPLQHIHDQQGKFYIWDSVLSEEAALAFEYGYSISQKNTLTVWEAQFGDFTNGAQIVIDQFICSSEQKWGISCNLVLLLPHGYEGQGPEHSSSRLERYLQLSAENNIKICIPTTASQMYHVLYNQLYDSVVKPLIIMTPKSLLRYPLSFSPLLEFSKNNFQTVIDEIDDINITFVKRVILCSGKIYYDLLNQRRINRQTNVVILRIEQLYPFPNNTLSKILQLYSNINDFIWCQEEPLNQGAWLHSKYYLNKILSKTSCLDCIGRPESSSTATGYMNVHKKQQKKLVYDALNVS
ncbi:MAG: 2-oxoglutarate dehydrogenase E1 component [Buchnera aphidicola (Kaburagia rhusicola rhusicola)]